MQSCKIRSRTHLSSIANVSCFDQISACLLHTNGDGFLASTSVSMIKFRVAYVKGKKAWKQVVRKWSGNKFASQTNEAKDFMRKSSSIVFALQLRTRQDDVGPSL